MTLETESEQAASEALFLALESASDEAMTFAEAHGYLSAKAVQTQAMDTSATLNEILGSDSESVSPEHNQPLQQACATLHLSLRQHMMQGETLNLPCDPESSDDPEHPPLLAWSIGFMQAVFESPDDWQSTDPELASELTLPILAVSNLLDDDEFAEMAENSELMQAFCDQIPDLLIDLFLLYNAPEDAKTRG